MTQYPDDIIAARSIDERCPRCNSPAPHLHPAMQWEGEVEICPDPWHGASEDRSRQEKTTTKDKEE